MTIEIKARYTNKIIYSSDKAKDIKECIEEAIKARVSLSGASLNDLVLCKLNLHSLDLSGADLARTNLSGANMVNTNLTGANLTSANLTNSNLYGSNLRKVNLSDANLSNSDLSDIDFSNSNLYKANLSKTNLFKANFSGVDLLYTNLSGANLFGVRGVNRYIIDPLVMLRDQPGDIVLYKLVNAESKGYMYPRLTYLPGVLVEEVDSNTDETTQCGAGINVCTLDWALKNWQEGLKILKVQFTSKDIAAIPINTDGKIRLFRCKVVGEVDLKAIGFLDENGKRI